MSHNLRSRKSLDATASTNGAQTSPSSSQTKKSDEFPLPPSPALSSRPQRNRNLPKGYSNFLMPSLSHKGSTNGNASANESSSTQAETTDEAAPAESVNSSSTKPESQGSASPYKHRLSPQLLSASTPHLTPLLSSLLASPSLPPIPIQSFPPAMSTSNSAAKDEVPPPLSPSSRGLSAGKSPAVGPLQKSPIPRRDSASSVAGYLNLGDRKNGSVLLSEADPSLLKGSPVLEALQALSSPSVLPKKGSATSPLLSSLTSAAGLDSKESRSTNFKAKSEKADGNAGASVLQSPAFPPSYPSPGFSSSILRSPNVSPTLPPFPSPGMPALGPLCSPVLRSALSSSPLGLMPLSAFSSSSSPLMGSSNGISLSSPLLSSLWHSSNALTLSPLLSSITGGNLNSLSGPTAGNPADSATAARRKRHSDSFDTLNDDGKEGHAEKRRQLTDLRWTDPSGVTSFSFRQNGNGQHDSANSEQDKQLRTGAGRQHQERGGDGDEDVEEDEEIEEDAEMGSDGEHIKDDLDPLVTNHLLHDHEAVSSLSSLASLAPNKHSQALPNSVMVKQEMASHVAAMNTKLSGTHTPSPPPPASSAASVGGNSSLLAVSSSSHKTAPSPNHAKDSSTNAANLPGITLPAYKPHNGFPLDSDVLLASIAAVLSGKTKELSNINKMLPLRHYRPCVAQTPAHLKRAVSMKSDGSSELSAMGSDATNGPMQTETEYDSNNEGYSDGEGDVKGLTPKAGNGSGSSCHQCKSRRHMSHLIFCCNMFAKKHGKGKRRICRKKYCWQCLQKFYQEKPPKKRQDPSSTWQCPACRSICCCALCRRVRQEKTDHQNVDPAMSLAFGFVYFNKIDQLGHDSKYRLDLLWRKFLSLSPSSTNEIADLADLSEIEIQQPSDSSPTHPPTPSPPPPASKLPSAYAASLGRVKYEGGGRR